MNKELLDYIQLLSKDDKKDLTGKALKTASEAGDLAEVVLSYQNQPGARHKFEIQKSMWNLAFMIPKFYMIKNG